MAEYIVPLVLGVGFGLALNKAGLTKYRRIAGAFRFTDMTVLKFMLTAIIVSMIGLYTLRGLGLLTFTYIPATYVVGNLVGGLLFGVGMALAGYCPGTCFAGAGEGKLDYLLPGGVGLLVGAMLYGLTYTYVFPPLSATAYFGGITLPDKFGLNPFLVITLFVMITLLLFYLIGRGLQRQDKVE